jgi:hypothetical protein
MNRQEISPNDYLQQHKGMWKNQRMSQRGSWDFPYSRRLHGLYAGSKRVRGSLLVKKVEKN